MYFEGGDGGYWHPWYVGAELTMVTAVVLGWVGERGRR